MKANERDELIDALIEGAISEADFLRLEAELTIDPTARRAYYDRIALAQALVVEAARVSDPVIRNAPVFRAWRTSLMVAAAAVVLLGGLAWLVSPGSAETGLVLASADGEVKVERAGAEMLLPVGTMLREGDVILTEGAGIVASYPVEETRLELDPHTRLEVLTHRHGKRLRLLAGSLSAEVSPQPEDSPMRIFTPGEEAVVLGTRFTLSADAANPANRELAVQKGAVRVNRAGGGGSIVVSSQERVSLGASSLEVEALPPPTPPRWRDGETLAFDFESAVGWPLLRTGRLAANPTEPGHCLTGELVELPRRGGSEMVLGVSLRPQCVLRADSRLSLRYWAAAGIESFRVYLYIFGVERAYSLDVVPEAHGRWIEWSAPFAGLLSASALPPAEGATVRSVSVHTSPVGAPLPFHLDDVALERVSQPAPINPAERSAP